MYLPKNQYRKKQTYGNEFINPDGTDYIGPYIETAGGLFLAGNNLNSINGEILPKTEENLLNIERPYNDYYGPTEENYKRGFFTRYFTRRRRNGKFVEMSKEQWNVKRANKGVTSGQINWFITGPVEDGEINGIPYLGTATKNNENLQRLETTYPGISNFFSNLIEFVR